MNVDSYVQFIENAYIHNINSYVISTMSTKDNIDMLIDSVTEKNYSPGRDYHRKSLSNIKWSSADDEPTPVQSFYRGANVFITGATGFLGKVLIEKLLRSCPDVNNIYLLVRSKRGKQVEERIDELVKSPCFDRLKEERPGFESKLVAVAGDIGVEGLGISDQDRHLLAEHVNIVFHVAATVKFDEQLNVAIKQNVRGTRDLLIMCKSFSKLKSLLHVSTAFSYCPNAHIEEKFYEPPIGCDAAIQMAECVDERFVDVGKLLAEWPNTYTFTKALAEDVVKIYGDGLPVGVLRPSIVMCTRREPVVGFIDNMYGPGGIFASIMAGVLRTTYCDDSKYCNCVPCDMVVNCLIVMAWEIAEKWEENGMIPIHNIVAVGQNETSWAEYSVTYVQEMRKTPYSGAIWYPMMLRTPSLLRLKMYRLLLHYFPAALIDGWATIMGNKPKMFKLYEKVHRFTDALTYFCQRSWTYEETGLTVLGNKMDARDRELFSFDMKSLVWKDYYKDTCLGLRQNLLKDETETLPSAKTRLQMLLLLHLAAQTVLLLVPAYLAVKIIPRRRRR